MTRTTLRKGFGALLLAACASACTSAWADCGEWALAGDWTVFYRDNGFPTSVLAPDERITIKHHGAGGTFSVSLSDPEWRAFEGRWESVCVNGQTILVGAIQRRGASTTLVMEISRVVAAADLVRNAAGIVRERQISIRFPEPFAAVGLGDGLGEAARRGELASHPGHAHGWE